MCGRFTLRASDDTIAEQFAVFDGPPWTPRFNIAPTQPSLVVRLRPDDPANRRELVALRWGLVPSWAKDLDIGARLINARTETAAEKPAFRAALRRRRCLVVADGFYEWQGVGRRRQPYFFRMRDDRPFAMAGLWECWEGPGHECVETFAILTTQPNALVRPIHDRMPVVLPETAYDAWLDVSAELPSDELTRFFTPYPIESMIAQPVGLHVNSPTHDDPRCIEP